MVRVERQETSRRTKERGRGQKGDTEAAVGQRPEKRTQGADWPGGTQKMPHRKH